MPPRIPHLPYLRSSQAQLSSAIPIILPFRSFTSTAPAQTVLTAHQRRKAVQQQKRRKLDPYLQAQAAARKAANLSRQEVLKKQRAAAFGHPVKGVTTPFVESFDTAGHGFGEPKTTHIAQKGSVAATSGSAAVQPQDGTPITSKHLKHFLSQEEIDQRLEDSFVLSAPFPESAIRRHSQDYGSQSPAAEGDAFTRVQEAAEAETTAPLVKAYRAQHDNAATAISRIVSLTNASGEDRRHTNIQRCIDVFGRQNTDTTLPERPVSLPAIRRNHPDPAAWAAEERVKAEERRAAAGKQQRAGPDTGSSEVQIAILTAKIRALNQGLETRGKGDKNGKRDLRLMVHRRQKLLKYLWRKEKGGPRWQHCVDTLGITDAAWKGEITLP